MLVIPAGIVYFLLYYFIFSFLIKKFDFKTPGREDDDTETKLYTKADVNARKAAKDVSLLTEKKQLQQTNSHRPYHEVSAAKPISQMWTAVQQGFVSQ